MTKKRIAVVLITAAMVFAAGIFIRDLKQKSMLAVSPPKNLEVRNGETFIIGLTANPTTGYEWQVGSPPDPDILQLVSNEYHPARTDVVGAGGKEVWTFKAVGAGKTRIGFIYLRPWEKDARPPEEANFIVTVKEG